ncbi:D-lactate dehydrogenase [Purpureocillium takamizusanense]|uniref:D-lactate dehydrogenase n=1 Tax=Purpureocillium takamizusanense TaxID=2060973 RepID=A0A9Q8QCM6_9HYPO|nr:D-lactate dehydrogenase [Purpureocillium takamizusanense]UNI16918.1 D-lactate dehydrogenase [Purpureocillium takamizusanense]
MMKIAVFSAKPYDKRFLDAALEAKKKQQQLLLQQQSSTAASGSGGGGIELAYHDFALGEDTAFLAKGADAVCVFVNDAVSAPVVEALADEGIKAILLRCAGFNNVALEVAERRGLLVANVPSYSPEAVAEFAVALIQTLNRNTHRAYNRVREGNFALDGLLGRTLHGKTVGIVGTGKIGVATGRILKGFGCRVLAADPYPTRAFSDEVGEYRSSIDELLPECDIVSLHCPLMDATRHIINERTLALMKPRAMLINTSRGALLDSRAVIKALKTKHLGGLALDVYEAEGSLFYDDHSGEIIQDDVLMRLITFPNVVICGHQAFFTEEALKEIAECTLRNLEEFAERGTCTNSLTDSIKKNGKGPLPVRNV